MGKHKEKSRKHKKMKKHKKARRSSSSSSTSEEWVEKTSSVIPDRDTNKTNQERDEWMSMSSSLYTVCSSDKRVIREGNKRLEREQNQYNPRKSERELNPYWKSGGDGLPHFKKPTEDKDNFEYKKNMCGTSNWRKKTHEATECNLSKSVLNSKPSEESETTELSNKDLNILAAKLVKAEIMGDNDLVNHLKLKLDEARKALENAPKDVKEVVLLTTDVQGMPRPLKSRSQHAGSSGINNKKQKIETHVDNKRVKYFADDDKYSLKQMFENEKYQSVDDQNKEFLKIASKAKTDLDDFFVDEIRKKDSDDKIHRKDINKAINMHKLMSEKLDNCKQCLQSDVMSKHLLISMGETIYLSVPPFEPVTEGHCLLVPLRHISRATQLDENEWSEMLNFRKSLCNMFNSMGEDIIFFETALNFHKYPHMVLHCIPLPKEQGDLAPIYFKKAIDESETEWSTNKKLISLSGRDVRRAVPKELPYFSVSFGMTEGYAHVIENERLFPQNFAQEIIGGMLDLHHSKWRKPKRQSFEEQSIRVQNFSKMWGNFDCTK